MSEQVNLEGYRAEMITAAADAGLRSAASADPDYVEDALEAIERLAATGQDFGADEVRALLGGVSRPSLGAAFRRASSLGLIRPVGVRSSSSVSRHGGLQRVWRGISDA